MTTRNDIIRTAQPVEESDLYAVTNSASLPSETYPTQTMPAVLGTRSMTTTFVTCIFLSTAATTAAAGGPAAFTYLILGAITFFVPSLVVTEQLGRMFPYEGALYNWTHRALGGYWSFFSGFCAWFPGVLIISSFAFLIVTYIHEMNNAWLAVPWQQGLVICGILLLSGFISTRRFLTVQYILNTLVALTLTGGFLVALAGVVWLASGQPVATNFGDGAAWHITPDNIVFFGLIVFAYIGAEGPLNLAGEMSYRQTKNSSAQDERPRNRIINRHLLWGGAIILVIYLTNTFSVLVVEGDKAAFLPYALITVVDKALGKFAGNIATICFMGSFIAASLVYNYMIARLLMVASIDGRLPAWVGRLNKHRVPSNAIMFQAILGVGVAIFGFLVLPAIPIFGTPEDLSTMAYNVTQAAATLVWAISTIFLFIDVIGCHIRYKKELYAKRVVPMAVLWLCVVVGTISCLLGMIDTLFYSWIPQISNTTWWFVVGGLTVVFLLMAAVGSMFANSEATWQRAFRE